MAFFGCDWWANARVKSYAHEQYSETSENWTHIDE